MNVLRKLLTPLLVAAAIFTPVLVAATPVAAVDISNELCKGIDFTEDTTSTTADCRNTTKESESEIKNIVSTIIDIFSIIVGAVSVIMIIIGGLRYITSAGDSSNVSGAKNTILYAIVGLVIVIFSQTIVKFVVGRLSD